jgi:hypothetical protein
MEKNAIKLQLKYQNNRLVLEKKAYNEQINALDIYLQTSLWEGITYRCS